MEEDIKVLEEKIKLNRKDFENEGYHCCFDEKTMQLVENIIKRNKELEEKVNKYEKQIDLEWVEENYIEKSKVNKYLNKMEKRCDKPKFSVMKKEIEQLLQKGDDK